MTMGPVLLFLVIVLLSFDSSGWASERSTDRTSKVQFCHAGCPQIQSHQEDWDGRRRERAPSIRPSVLYGRDRISREERRYVRKLDRWAKRYHYQGASEAHLDRIHRNHSERIDRMTRSMDRRSPGRLTPQGWN